VVHLGEKFGFPRQEATKETRIMVVAVGDEQAGLLVDSVSEVLHLSEDDFQPPPRMIKGIRGDFIRGIGKKGDRLIILPDLSRIFRESGIAQLILPPAKAAPGVPAGASPSPAEPFGPESERDQVVEAAKAMAQGDFGKEVNRDLYGQVGELAKYINATLRKLQKLEPNIRVTSGKIPEASLHLSEITRITEEATQQEVLSHIEHIMDNHDAMAASLGSLEAAGDSDQKSVHLKELRRLVQEDQEILMEVMTGLSFQDLTGQKIKKIITMVEEIEKRILQLLVTFGIEQDPRAREEMLRAVSAARDIKQDRVDEILKGFGF
jgi:chemotaxis regulatin CheY-phosphate phosphatase CheZ